LLVAGKSVDVELDVRGAYLADRFERTVRCASGFTVESESLTLICGVVSEIDFQDVLEMNVGGCLLSFDVEGNVPLGLEGAVVRILVDELEIYPTGI
jgi:hypothetical protein